MWGKHSKNISNFVKWAPILSSEKKKSQQMLKIKANCFLMWRETWWHNSMSDGSPEPRLCSLCHQSLCAPGLASAAPRGCSVHRGWEPLVEPGAQSTLVTSGETCARSCLSSLGDPCQEGHTGALCFWLGFHLHAGDRAKIVVAANMHICSAEEPQIL